MSDQIVERGGQREPWGPLAATVLGLIGAAGFVLGATPAGAITAQASRLSPARSALTGPERVPQVDLLAFVEDFVSRIPRKGSEGYHVPTPEQANTMAFAYQQIMAGHIKSAGRLVAQYRYVVQPYIDQGTGRRMVVLYELQEPGGTWDHAWGMYIYAPLAGSTLTVEVAHPIADRDTEKIGVETFRDADATHLFIAGAHRDADADGSADVTRNVNSLFEVIHKTVLVAGRNVFQPHGFAVAYHPNDGDIVVSSGIAPPEDIASSLASAFSSAGFGTCLYDGVLCSDLSGSETVQGDSARAAGAHFVHVEFSDVLRSDPDLMLQVSSISAQVLG